MAQQWTELEKTGNKVTTFSETPTDTNYPNEKIVKAAIDKLKTNVVNGNVVVAQVTTANNAVVAQYASVDETKGTIEERLTNLGF